MAKGVSGERKVSHEAPRARAGEAPAAKLPPDASGTDEAVARPEDWTSVDNRFSLIAHRINARFTEIANQLLSIHGINMYDARILLFLLEKPEMRVGELVEATALPQSTISHQLNRLQKRKLVRRRRIADDNRAVVVSLTTSGKYVASECDRFSMDVHRGVIAEFSTRDLERLRRMLDRMYAVLSSSHFVPERIKRLSRKGDPHEPSK